MADLLEKMWDQYNDLEELYNAQFEEDKDDIQIENAVMSDCLKNQIKLQLTWEEIYKTLEFFHSEAEIETEKMFSVAFRDLSNDSYKKLSFNEAKIFAKSDQDYIDSKKLEIKINGLKARAAAVVDAIKSRKFILKNICEALRDGTDSHII